MEIIEAGLKQKNAWNQFVGTHYPPVGAFMQTWEWGTFQEQLGRKINRCFLMENGTPMASFMLVHHALPLGFSYGYIPRGPVIAGTHQTQDKILDIFHAARSWILRAAPHLVFLRIEPPLGSMSEKMLHQHGFLMPPYYIQPRHNAVITLEKPEQKILESFHPSTRSNIRRAEKRGVRIEVKSTILPSDYEHFFAMMRDTITRNSGYNAYPTPAYFYSFTKAIPMLTHTSNFQNMSYAAFYGYQDNQPAAAHFVLFFGDTATYLFGASYTDRLSSKVTTALHWTAMRKAKERGLRFYDLGGVDTQRWPTLTQFKRQFRGDELSYIGIVDVPLKPTFYRIYNLLRRLKK
ncbi:MAG: Methicillin resistance protein [Parcubacteria group bacterium Gr01-1014_66]|nr:MAG: Methicillin resistance protein [Parcubacteria group bacterium Gr01-1014_66]